MTGADNPLDSLLRGRSVLREVAESPLHELQVLYTQIDRNEDNEPAFKTFSWNADDHRYFYPASTVKLPAAILALERLEALGINGLDQDTAMRTLPLPGQVTAGEPVAGSAPPTLARHIRDIFLVSSNDAYNRLFEFVGPRNLSEGLQWRGYAGVRIFHRLAVAREPGPVITNAIEFTAPSGEALFSQPPLTFGNSWVLPRPLLKGIAFIENGGRIGQPKDFAALNAFPLAAQQRMLRALVFPLSVPENDRFQLSGANRRFLLREMSRWLSESTDPPRDSSRHGNSCSKLLFFGTEAREPGDPDVRMFSKSGMAYGTLTDNAYFADFDNGIEFFLSATLLVNANGTFNDDIYEYDSIGIPFLRELGRALHAYERRRARPFRPDLGAVQFEYSPAP